MRHEERRTSTLSAKLTNAEYSALIEHSWTRRQKISDLVRDVLGRAGMLSMPVGAAAPTEPASR